MLILYAEDNFAKIESKRNDLRPRNSPFWIAPGADVDGYGAKITTEYMVKLDGQGTWRRVYATCFSNVASFWITVAGVKYHFRNEENLRLIGGWPATNRTP